MLQTRKAYRRLRQQVDRSKFCAGGVGGEGVCYGDSGGKKYPIIIHMKIITKFE